MPEYKTYLQTGPYPTTNPLPTWYSTRSNSALGYDLLCRLFDWDPAKRITARETLQHAWFQEEGGIDAEYVLLSCIPALFRHTTSQVLVEASTDE
jgi:cyclin-dependent kinase 8/11